MSLASYGLGGAQPEEAMCSTLSMSDSLSNSEVGMGDRMQSQLGICAAL